MMLYTTLFILAQLLGSPQAGSAPRRSIALTIAAVVDPAPVQDPDVYPVPIYKARRVYPESARRDSLQGTVLVEAVVDQSGHVQDAKVKTGIRDDLDNAAISCIRQWVFNPALQKGKPVNCTIVMPFHFKLKR